MTAMPPHTCHNANGDLSYFSWEGTSNMTPKDEVRSTGQAFLIVTL